jgi:hypothetical protein
MIRIITAATFVVAFAIPAFAATKFYVVQDKTTKSCSVVEAKPTDKTMKVIGGAHKTQALAEAAMKKNKSCVKT